MAGLVLVASAASAQSPAPPIEGPPAQLSGQVLDAASGRPVRMALIEMAGLGSWAQADANGAFRLANVPPGPQELVVRAIGYSPVHVRTQFMARDSLTMQVVLTRIPPTLSTVEVEAEFEEQYEMRLRQFEESRSLGAGRHLDWRFFQKHQNTGLTTLLNGQFGAFRVGLAGAEFANKFVVTRSSPPCLAAMWVNGMRGDGGIRLEWLNTADVLGLEFYTPATTPARYNATGSNTSCGTVVLWIK
ncbi:MAG TPA: carboxypeptidase regulatory-like domain-containing protein [Gemmatimonas sp.]|uniref:carboxypeptidase regulatory-like domain-containing protein n=1 Tax=Gemmatimonas sp. TaxID=1962908 RepID=UPI002EDB7910